MRPVVLDKQVQGELEQLARGRSLPARLVERARIVLRAAAGVQDQQIAAELGIRPAYEKSVDGALPAPPILCPDCAGCDPV
jgi:hypothetical protein